MRLSEIARHPRQWNYDRVRRAVAGRWLVGSGVEVGALHNPYPVPAGVAVRYVDRLSTADLRAEYPELADRELVSVDLLDDGEALTTLDDASQDFVIASHFLEHCEDPVATLQNHLRVVRSGGSVLLALPDRRQGLDRHRDATTLEHLIADHDSGTELSRRGHYHDWATLVDLPLGNIESADVNRHATALESRRYSIHFHCWTEREFVEQLGQIIERFQLPGRVIEHRANYHEFLVVLARDD
ncbi:MAG TPA: methyltransferase domain-containing protein [Solirubrobacteraceae bacterium]|jgi:SAM-dependent methyltransferase